MIKKTVALIFAILLCFPIFLSAREISDVEIPESLNYEGVPLVLNGAGIRSKFFMDVYVSALYLEIKSQDADMILRDDKPMGIRLHIVSGLVDAEKLKDAISDGFDQSTGGNIDPIKSQISQFMAIMGENVVKGDFFDFIYLPDVGLKVYKNTAYTEDIKGLNFKRAFFGIWLGDDPADDDLKEEMLGL
ncbi:chalcone isomerase family protein [bacterium]|nr:chalcone isomerase family protein [bacterium]